MLKHILPYPTSILAPVSNSGCWSLAQSGSFPKPSHKHVNGCCSSSQPGLPTIQALTLTHGCGSLARESPKFPCWSQLHILYVLVDTSNQLGLLTSNLNSHWWVLELSSAGHSPYPLQTLLVLAIRCFVWLCPQTQLIQIMRSDIALFWTATCADALQGRTAA